MVPLRLAKVQALAALTFESSIGSPGSEGPLLLLEQLSAFATPCISVHAQFSAFSNLCSMTRPGDIRLETPQFIGKYEVLGRLGAGGMAEVFLARRSGAAGFEKKVAIKRLATHKVEDEVLIRSLINEARLVAQLSHQNLVQVLEFELIERAYCMAMEYIDGMTLDAIMDRCAQAGIYLPSGLAIYIAQEVCAGLDYAHTAKGEDGTALKLVHRDIKPANIMISRQGQVKIMDFGIAKASTNTYKTTAHGGVKGTLAYMSPEQLSGEQDLQPASDLYSFGLVLYELATLQRLYDDSNLFKLAASMQEGLNAEARERLMACYPELVPIVAKLLNFYPDLRYPDARALMYELRPLAFNTGALELAEFLKDLEGGSATLRSAKTVASTPSLLLRSPVRAENATGLPLPQRGSTEALPSEAIMAFGTGPVPAVSASHGESSGTPAASGAGAAMGRASGEGNLAGAVPAGPSGGENSGAKSALSASPSLPVRSSVAADSLVSPPGDPERPAHTYTRRHLVATAAVTVFLVVSLGLWWGMSASRGTSSDPATQRIENAGGPGQSAVDPAVGSGEGQSGSGTAAPASAQAENAAAGSAAPGSTAPVAEGAGTGPQSVKGSDVESATSAGLTEGGPKIQEPEKTGESVVNTGAKPAGGRPKTSGTTPARTPSPRQAPVAAASAPVEPVGTGTLRLFARPWAQVYVDGRRVGEVPYLGEARVGSHSVRLVTSDGAEKSFTITVKANEESRRGWDFNSNDWIQ